MKHQVVSPPPEFASPRSDPGLDSPTEGVIDSSVGKKKIPAAPVAAQGLKGTEVMKGKLTDLRTREAANVGKPSKSFFGFGKPALQLESIRHADRDRGRDMHMARLAMEVPAATGPSRHGNTTEP